MWSDDVPLSKQLLKGNSIIYFYDSSLTGTVPEPYQNTVKINFYYIASTSFFQFYIF
nr:MAG TPA: hypothetical protein [Caudoviricetes sp.]